MSVVIKVEDLSKIYQLGEIGTGTVSRDLQRYWARLQGKDDPHLKIGETNDRTKKGESGFIWSLKDISFDINQGDAVGIIGRNGAGKSTLLKILSRVTAPTGGSVKLKGRIASLLEVGTGFHPELTGRENIYLNGAILGMRKAEIKRKFDEIVDFSGVERYIDTPVKRYSSGMYVRLAFAVAAHLESEILVVDEVLAVGDAEFQKKCLGKMGDVSKGEGKTVLFVSHNMAAIQSLCNSCLFLDRGHLLDGPNSTNSVLNKYISHVNEALLTTPIAERQDREGEGLIRVKKISMLNEFKQVSAKFISGQKAIFSIEIHNLTTHLTNEPLEITMSISRLGGALITVISSKYINADIRDNRKTNIINFVLAKMPLMSGSYSINLMIRSHEVIQDWLTEATVFEVENGDYYQSGVNVPETHNSIYIDYSINHL